MAYQMRAGENQHKYRITINVTNLNKTGNVSKCKSLTTCYVGSENIEDKIVDSFLPRFKEIEKRGHRNAAKN